MREQLLFINGEWVKPETGKFGEKVNPSTGEVSGKFALATREEADRAIDTSYEVQRKWEGLTSVERSRYVYILMEATHPPSQGRTSISSNP
jgi:NAD-dependent aldehyde dehydrogenases